MRKLILSISRRTTAFDVDPLLVKWDMKKPPDVDVKKWRRVQLGRYLDVFPAHKPKDVLKQLEMHKTNPQPGCTTHQLSQQLLDIKKNGESSMEQASYLSWTKHCLLIFSLLPQYRTQLCHPMQTFIPGDVFKYSVILINTIVRNPSWYQIGLTHSIRILNLTVILKPSTIR